jgi:hypothetical protein
LRQTCQRPNVIEENVIASLRRVLAAVLYGNRCRLVRDHSLPQTLTSASRRPFAAFSISLRLNDEEMQTLRLGSGSKISCPRNLLARVMSTSDFDTTSSTTSWRSLSSASVVGGGLSRNMWIRAELMCEGIWMIASLFGTGGGGIDPAVEEDPMVGTPLSVMGKGSSLERIWRNRRMLACRVDWRAGCEFKIEIAVEAVVASMAGSDAEKTEAEELIRW